MLMYNIHIFFEGHMLTVNKKCIFYKYKQYVVKHNSIDDFIKVYLLHCFFQQHLSALVISYLQVDYFS